MAIAAMRLQCWMLAAVALGGAARVSGEPPRQLVIAVISDPVSERALASGEEGEPGIRITDQEPEPPAIEEEPLLRPFIDAATGFSEIAFGDTYVPNMMGDLLGATQSVSYFLTRTGPLPGSEPAAPAGEIIWKTWTSPNGSASRPSCTWTWGPVTGST